MKLKFKKFKDKEAFFQRKKDQLSGTNMLPVLNAVAPLAKILFFHNRKISSR
jgi:hypothetical protein